MNKLKSLMLFRLKNQIQFFNLTSRNQQVRRYSAYTISGYIIAFLMLLGYVAFIVVDLKINYSIQDFFVLFASILFWGIRSMEYTEWI